MADNRQLAYVLALVGGIAALANVLIALLVMTAFAGIFAHFAPFEWSFGGPAMFAGDFAAFAILVLSVAIGIALIVLAPRLRSDDAETRRTAAIWCLAAGGVALVATGGVLSGALGLAAGVMTLMADQGARPSA